MTFRRRDVQMIGIDIAEDLIREFCALVHRSSIRRGFLYGFLAGVLLSTVLAVVICMAG